MLVRGGGGPHAGRVLVRGKASCRPGTGKGGGGGASCRPGTGKGGGGPHAGRVLVKGKASCRPGTGKGGGLMQAGYW